jgi:Flp pilus assembly protein TadB
MEFEELQKIWDAQNSRPLYAIDEKTLHNRILSKKRQAYHITNSTELLLIIVNVGVGGFLLELNFSKPHPNIFTYVMAAWMFCTTLYVWVSRIQRIKRNKDRFEQSMRGDLEHAISTAAYQVQLSQIMRWNLLPIGLLTFLCVWEGGKSAWLAGGTLLFFAVTYYASGFEHRFYKRRKRELQMLQKNLDREG